MQTMKMLEQALHEPILSSKNLLEMARMCFDAGHGSAGKQALKIALSKTDESRFQSPEIISWVSRAC